MALYNQIRGHQKISWYGIILVSCFYKCGQCNNIYMLCIISERIRKLWSQKTPTGFKFAKNQSLYFLDDFINSGELIRSLIVNVLMFVFRQK